MWDLGGPKLFSKRNSGTQASVTVTPQKRTNSIRRTSLFGASFHSCIADLLILTMAVSSIGSTTSSAVVGDVQSGEAQVQTVGCISKGKIDKSGLPSHLSKIQSFALLKSAYLPPCTYITCSKTHSIAILQVFPLTHHTALT